MLASINPLGERARNQSYPLTVTAYIAASTVAAAAFGALLGAAGQLIPHDALAPRVAILGALALVGLAFDARVMGLRVPGPHRQVNEDWLVEYRGWVYGAGFGAQLGVGVVTIVTASATWLALACAIVSGSPVAGALIGIAFGATRAVPILATARVHDPSALRSRLRRLQRARPPAARVVAVVQAVLGVGLIVGAGRLA